MHVVTTLVSIRHFQKYTQLLSSENSRISYRISNIVLDSFMEIFPFGAQQSTTFEDSKPGFFCGYISLHA